MLYCFDRKLNFDYIKKEIELAKLLGKCIFYNSENKTFLDTNGDIISIDGQVIFPRTGVSQIYDMNKAILSHGGKIISRNDEIERVELWPYYYKTKRKVVIVRGYDLIDSNFISFLEENYGSEIFIKTRVKNFSSVIPLDLLKDNECMFYKALKEHLDDEFFISEKIDIVNDELGYEEYRCFVIDGKIANISRYTTSILHKIDESILDKANEIIDKVKDSFPKSYVIDLCVYVNDNEQIIDVVEFNPIHAAGIYLYNSIINNSDDILHDDIYNVAYEFKYPENELSESGEIESNPSILYEVPGSFANDLRSFIVSGRKGITYTSVPIYERHFKLHAPLFDPSTAKQIKSDDELVDYDEKIKNIEKNYNFSPDLMMELKKVIERNRDMKK